MPPSNYAHLEKLSPKEKRQWLSEINGNLQLEGVISPKEVNLMQEDWIIGKISTEEMFQRFEKIVLNAIKDEL